MLLDRLGRSQSVTRIVVATTDDPADDAIEEFCEGWGVPTFRGSEDDVLGRFVGAAAMTGAGVIVRVTADCPFLEPTEVDRLVGEFTRAARSEDPFDYVTNQRGEERVIPRGLDVEVMSRAALERAGREASDAGDREHVTPYLYRVQGRFRTRYSPPSNMDLGHLRLTVDTPEDLALVLAIVRELGSDASLESIAALLRKRPDLVGLNSATIQRGLDSEGQRRRKRIAGGRLIGRADACPTTGSGHVARVFSLLAAWRELGGCADLASRSLSPFWKDKCDRAGIDVVGAPGSLDEWDVAGAAAVVVDGYGFNDAEIENLSRRVTTIRINDFAEGPVLADVDVDPNLSGTKRAGVLAGPDFALFRPEFRRPPAFAPDAGRRIVVSLGSSDPLRVTVPIARALMGHVHDGVEVLVVIGPGVDPADVEDLERLSIADRRLVVARDVTDMPSVFRTARVAVIAAGTTTLECLTLGVVPIALQVVENQRPVGTGLEQSGAGIDLGWHEDCDFDDMAKKVDSLLTDEERIAMMAARGRSLVDGRGVWRIIDAALTKIETRQSQTAH